MIFDHIAYTVHGCKILVDIIKHRLKNGGKTGIVSYALLTVLHTALPDVGKYI